MSSAMLAVVSMTKHTTAERAIPINLEEEEEEGGRGGQDHSETKGKPRDILGRSSKRVSGRKEEASPQEVAVTGRSSDVLQELEAGTGCRGNGGGVEALVAGATLVLADTPARRHAAGEVRRSSMAAFTCGHTSRSAFIHYYYLIYLYILFLFYFYFYYFCIVIIV